MGAPIIWRIFVLGGPINSSTCFRYLVGSSRKQISIFVYERSADLPRKARASHLRAICMVHRRFTRLRANDIGVCQNPHKARQMFIDVPFGIRPFIIQISVGRVIHKKICQMKRLQDMLPELLIGLRIPIHEGGSSFITCIGVILPDAP